MIRSFLDEFGPEGGLDELDQISDAEEDASLKSDASGQPVDGGHYSVRTEQDNDRETFLKRLVPLFVKFTADDRRVMQDASDLLRTFVQRHFRSNKELTLLLDKPDRKSVV